MVKSNATFSIRTMILITFVMCGFCAAIFRLASIPIVNEELKVLFNLPTPEREAEGRGGWLAFLMFTYTAPLVMATVLYVTSAIWRWFDQRAEEPTDDLEPF